jgi:hypothetical protein
MIQMIQDCVHGEAVSRRISVRVCHVNLPVLQSSEEPPLPLAGPLSIFPSARRLVVQFSGLPWGPPSEYVRQVSPPMSYGIDGNLSVFKKTSIH